MKDAAELTALFVGLLVLIILAIIGLVVYFAFMAVLIVVLTPLKIAELIARCIARKDSDQC